MELGKVVIPSDYTDARTMEISAKLASEMRAFTPNKNEHTGDSLMALWFAFSEIRELVGDRIIMPRTALSMIKDSPPVDTAQQRAEFEKEADKAIALEQEYERSNFQRMMRTFRH